MILLALLSVPRQGTAAEIALRIDDAKQLAIAHAPEVILARYAVEEAETALQAALIGGAFGPAESGVQAAKTKLRQAQEDFLNELIRIALEAEEAYYTLLYRYESVRIERESMEQADRRFAAASARHEAGLLSEIDYLQAELSYEQSLYSLQRAERQLDDAERRFRRLLGLGEAAELILVDDSPFEPLRLTLDEALKEAAKSRIEIREAEHNLNEARRRLEQLNSFFTAPVEMEAAAKAVRRAEIQLEKTRQQVLDAVYDEWWALQDAEQRVKTAEKRRSLAQQSLAIMEARFADGRVSFLDLLTAEKEAAQAKLEAANSVWEYNRAKARLLHSIGRAELPPLPDEIAEYIRSWPTP